MVEPDDACGVDLPQPNAGGLAMDTVIVGASILGGLGLMASVVLTLIHFR